MKSACVLLLFVVAACALPLEEIALDINPVKDAVVANVEGQIGTELNDVIRDKRQFGGELLALVQLVEKFWHSLW